ncbi:zf-ZPR1-domain-containing protein [Cristinia sonorae]|uniref:Zf-ZPR1-domain-containing protein n=1 Tax=Cristinia sonorae TaxID=1940300 RepID=A0A8K0UJZ0_9AGAR|nr:zf-ZPR1-domain-containing protein [Cristinia sonorae]
MSESKSEPLFPAIRDVAEVTDSLPESKRVEVEEAQDEERPVTEVESLCMQCHENGVTSFLLTSIPFFREVIIMSFRCEHCGYKNNEIQSAGAIRPNGVVYTARVLNRGDLNRTLVKSNTCTITIPELELTIPSSKGQLTNIEGLLRDIVSDLSADQPLRRIENEAVYTKIQEIIDACKDILGDTDDDDEDEQSAEPKEEQPEKPMKPFTVKIDDPAGNSFIEFVGSMADPKWNMRTYQRTFEQNVALGLVDKDAAPQQQAVAITSVDDLKDDDRIGGGFEGNEELFVFPGSCGSCGHPSDTIIKKLNIPYFKDVLIMSTSCQHCGYRDSEVKSGSAISPLGKKITLKVEDREDLSRDILKSESCGVTIPEIDLVLQSGTLGGRFTTLEGILDQVYEELSEKVFVDAKADGGAYETFLEKLKAVKNVDMPFTLILDDPLANSYLQNIYAPDPDPNMEIVTYERTWDQNEDWGLNDMKVEGYEGDPMLENNEVKEEEKAVAAS